MVKGKDNIHDSLEGTAKELIQNIKTSENNVFITIGGVKGKRGLRVNSFCALFNF